MSTQPPLPSPEPDKDAIINRLLKETNRDSLTGVYNARYFREMLGLEVERARRYKVPLSLLMGEIDQIRQVNDTFGHVSGDKVLKAVAELIITSSRVTDFVCRIEGEDKLAIILTHTERTGACQLVRHLRNRLERLQLPDELRGVAVGVTFGVGQYQPRESSDSFIIRVYRALYRAKNGFGNGIDDDDSDEGLLGVPVRV
jgi:diguanylate cyclase (GGDEF)-like protein